MMAGNGSSGGHDNKPYDENGWDKYVNYEFSNIIFPKEFVLPEQWQIMRDKSNYLVINAWMNAHHKRIKNGFGEYSDKHGYVNNINMHKMQESFPTITFEQFQKYVLGKTTPTITKLPFGNLEFTITKSSAITHGYAACSQGHISYHEIKAIVDWFDKDFTLLGHKMVISHEGNWFIKFGCCEGTLAEAKAILKAFN